MSIMKKVQRVPGKKRTNLSFADFLPTQLASEVRMSKAREATATSPAKPSGPYFVAKALGYKSEDEIYLGVEEVCAIQDENPTTKILINDSGDIASLGEDCVINPKAILARTQGILAYAGVPVKEFDKVQ